MSMRFGCGHTRYEDSCNECFMIGENTRLLSTLESCRAELAGVREMKEAHAMAYKGASSRAEAAEAALKDSRELYAVAESLRQHAEAALAEARAEVAKLIQSTGEHITVRSELRAENAALLAKIEKIRKVNPNERCPLRGASARPEDEPCGECIDCLLAPTTPTKEK